MPDGEHVPDVPARGKRCRFEHAALEVRFLEEAGEKGPHATSVRRRSRRRALR